MTQTHVGDDDGVDGSCLEDRTQDATGLSLGILCVCSGCFCTRLHTCTAMLVLQLGDVRM